MRAMWLPTAKQRVKRVRNDLAENRKVALSGSAFKSPSRALLFLSLLPLMNGCLVRTRRIQQAKMPSTVMTATADELVNAVNVRCQTIQSLSATVVFKATVGGEKNGKEKTYTSFNGYIRLRKPESLRVIGLVPVLHTRAFDLASNGTTFTLWIPHENKVFEGANTVTHVSPNTLENFRPNIFSDSLLLNCIKPDDLVTLTSNTLTKIDVKSKELVVQPDYDLSVLRRKGTTQDLIPERVIHFNRIDLRPYEEDIYDAQGAIQTQAIYGADQKFGEVEFPGTITIKRPLEEYQIVITFSQLITNLKLNNEMFELQTPASAKVQELH